MFNIGEELAATTAELKALKSSQKRETNVKAVKNLPDEPSA